MIYGILCKYRAKLAIGAQIAAIEDFCARREFPAPASYLYVPGGIDPSGPWLDPILRAVSPGDTVICTDFPALGRFASDALIRLAELYRIRCRVLAVHDPFDPPIAFGEALHDALRIAHRVAFRAPRRGGDVARPARSYLESAGRWPSVLALQPRRDEIRDALLAGKSIKAIAREKRISYFTLYAFITTFLPDAPRGGAKRKP